MTYKSKVLCDSCQRESEAPSDGGFPFEWVEINWKAQRGTAPVRSRFHLCAACCDDIVCIGDMIEIRENVAMTKARS
jgi:hypothetical protein